MHKLVEGKITGEQAPENAASDREQNTTERLQRARKSLLEQRLRGRAGRALPIQPREESSIYPLSFAQKRLWFMEQIAPDSPFYNMYFALSLKGEIEVSLLQKSFAELVQRHEILRTGIKTAADGSPVAVFASHVPEIEVFTIDNLSWERDQQQLEKMVEAKTAIPFDLAQPPLVRAYLWHLSSQEHLLLFVFHHSIGDGWSLDIFWDELVTSYQAFCQGKPASLPSLPIQYADFASWQQKYVQEGHFNESLAYWRRSLAGAPLALDLPTDHPRPGRPTYRGERLRYPLSPALAARLHSFAQDQGVTLFMLALAAYAILLARISGQQELLIGTPVAGRTRKELEPLMGLFVNTLALRLDLANETDFLTFLQKVRTSCLEAYVHQEIPFEQVVEAAQPVRDASRSPLFQVMFALQQASKEQRTLPGTQAHALYLDNHTAKFDLSLFLEESAEGEMEAQLEYATDLFTSLTATRMLHAFAALLQGIVDRPESNVYHLPLLSEQAQQELIARGNMFAVPDRSAADAETLCLHQLFEQQVTRTPEAIALQWQDERWSYQHLNARANRLAHLLLQYGIGPEERVALHVPRTAQMIATLLAILKSGGAYLPLDPAYPAQRLNAMLADARPRVLIVQRAEDLHALHYEEGTLLILDEIERELQTMPAINPTPALQPDNLAYVLYTSGSTGQPKGVALSHRGGSALVSWALRTLSPDAFSGVLATTSICFDLSVFEIFTPLACGGRIILAQNAIDLATMPADIGITLINTVPSAMNQLVESHCVPSSVHTICLAGEQLPQALVKRIYQLPHVRSLYNLYGPTEGTTYSTWALMPGDIAMRPAIGQPVNGTCVYLLDQHLQLVPDGALGELYIAGVGLARGYFQQPALTAERFVPNPFGEPGSRLYRTGDQARWRTPYELEYTGRLDHQVKWHGFRIELGEIESALQQLAGVDASLATMQGDAQGRSQLVAYIVPSHEHMQMGERLDEHLIRDFLRQKLPEYMLPVKYVCLDAFPLNPNGKIDRKALPQPQWENQHSVEQGLPRTHSEEILLSIWREVLKREDIAVHDNFFELGGDSILSITIIARAHQRGMKITPMQVFQHQTIADLAQALEVQHIDVPPLAVDVQGPAPLTPIQRWFFEQKFVQPQHWNQAMLLACAQPLDPTLVEATLSHLIAYHDALRLRFSRIGHEWQQTVVEKEEHDIFRYIHFRSQPFASQQTLIEQATAEAQSSLDFEHGPLIKAIQFGCDGKPSLLFVCIHHLAVDGYSWRVLLEDFQTVYQQLEQNMPPALPARTLTFSAWARHLHQYAQHARLATETEYWRTQSRMPAAKLPVDYPDAENDESALEIYRLQFSADDTQRLLRVAATPGIRINDVLLAALLISYRNWCGEDTLRFDLEGHGREPLFADSDVSRTIGWFTALYPVQLHSTSTSPARILQDVHYQLAQIPQHGVLYGIARYLTEKAVPELKQLSSQLVFNYLGRYDQSINEDSWLAPSDLSIGPAHGQQNNRSHLLEIDGQIAAEGLNLDWSFSRHLYQPATIRRWAEHYRQALLAVISDWEMEGNRQAIIEHVDTDLDIDAIERAIAEITLPGE